MKESKWTERRVLLLTAAIIFAAAWVLRFVYVMQLRGSPLADFPIVDELYHVEWARALAAGDWVGSEVFFRAPLYPYTLGALFSIFGENLLATSKKQRFEEVEDDGVIASTPPPEKMEVPELRVLLDKLKVKYPAKAGKTALLDLVNKHTAPPPATE